ncbi:MULTISPECIES: DNA ligase-like domain-containing protein [unclassified Bradyrhizobium]|uniref:hypothetical protein n=1 Tax=Bradyrhizobium sp. USDA 4541 TaxID=2817704 RepID=UPI0020A587CB|nr:hypothetical protein [Bradyrhizobium sp. USDA 4541]MCP1851221.1 hypothetical protein [Bradyrhizobium sp. USDA 4541]
MSHLKPSREAAPRRTCGSLERRREGHLFLGPYERGEISPDVFRKVCEFGFEGLVSKRADRPYRGGRSPHWIKVKNRTHPAMSRVMDALR